MGFDRLLQQIENAKIITIFRHTNPDCDALGSQFGLKNWIQDNYPDKQVYALIGGFHLHNKSEKEVRELAKKIRDTKVSYVCTGHCTGKKAYAVLQEELGDMLHQLHVGLSMEF